MIHSNGKLMKFGKVVRLVVNDYSKDYIVSSLSLNKVKQILNGSLIQHYIPRDDVSMIDCYVFFESKNKLKSFEEEITNLGIIQ